MERRIEMISLKRKTESREYETMRGTDSMCVYVCVSAYVHNIGMGLSFDTKDSG